MKKEKRAKIGSLITDGMELPLFETEQEAKKEAERLGADPAMCHQHTVDGVTYYMPFKDHDEAKEILDRKHHERIYHDEDEEKDYHEEEKIMHDEEDKMHHEEKEMDDEDRDAHYKVLLEKLMELIKESDSEMMEEERDSHYKDIIMKIKDILMEEYDRMHHEKKMDHEDKRELRSQKNEKRFFTCKIETRVKKDGDRKVVVGHASVFNKMSEDLGGFREIIKPGAFDNVLKDDVRVFFNHDANLILGRTKSGTAKISTDREGLVYQFEVPDTTYGRDLLVSMERGDVNQSSFAFSVEKDSWSEKNGRDIRTIEKVARLYDVSPVSIPAYPDADSLQVAKRGLEKFKNNEKNKSYSERELLDLKINILKRK